jgi:DNA-binding GntR family transcriptional regulator
MNDTDTVEIVRPTRKKRPRRRSSDLSTTAYNELRTLIIQGRLAPGSSLSENDIANRLRLSRTPVRTALQRLHQEGFLKMLRVGHIMRAVVSPLTADDMRELFLISGALEGLAVRITATLPQQERDALASEMSEINRRLRAAIEQQPPAMAEAGELHVRFHRTHVERSAGPRLRAQLDSIQPQVERYERAYTTVLIGGFYTALDEHDTIVEALRVGNADAAEAAVVTNWRNGAERYAKVVAMLGERGAW